MLITLNNLSLNKTNNQIPSKKQKVAFSGDKFFLIPYTKLGIDNKRALIKDEFYVDRTDINEDAILECILDKNNHEAVLITGPVNSGKSVMAGRLAHKLEMRGETVFKIDNSNMMDLSTLTEEKLNKLIDDIKNLKNSGKVYIFLDEPHFITYFQHYDDTEIVKKPEKSVLYKLSEFAKNNKNVKLVGVMCDTAPALLESNVCLSQREIIEAMFPEQNHFYLPEISTLKKEKVIEMINRALNSVGFNSMPKKIENQLLQMKATFDVRSSIKTIFQLLSQDYDRKDNLKKMEDIKDELWEKLVDSYF